MTVPGQARAGGCVCGAVRYRVEPGLALLPYACHCRDCQTRSGSTCMVTMLVRSGGFSFEGETMSATQHKPDGAEVKQFACPRCWTHLWAEISTLPAFVTLRAGTLDDSEALIPAMHIWTLSKQAWVAIPDDVPTYLRSPAQRSDYARHLMPK